MRYKNGYKTAKLLYMMSSEHCTMHEARQNLYLWAFRAGNALWAFRFVQYPWQYTVLRGRPSAYSIYFILI